MDADFGQIAIATGDTLSASYRQSELTRHLRIPQPNMQLTQLLLRDGRRRINHQILPALRLGERDHVTNRFGFTHHGHDAIQAERDTCVRWCAVLQRVKQKAELGALIFLPDTERGELFGLQFRAMDTH